MRMIKLMVRIGVLGLFVFLLSCKNDDGDTPSGSNTEQDSLIVAYLADSAITTAQRDTSGIYYYPITLNPGGTTQASGDVLSFYYNVSVLGGQLIDDYDELDGDPIRVRQGVSAIYPVGLDVGLSFMREGEEYSFILPSAQAYEDFSFSTLIPENSIILFNVRLITIESEQDILNQESLDINQYIFEAKLDSVDQVPLDSIERFPSGLIYKRLAAGVAGELPQSGDVLEVVYQGRFLDSTVFDTKTGGNELVYAYSTGLVLPGFDLGMGLIERGERALIIFPSLLGYRESAVVVPSFLTDEMIERQIVPTYAAKVPAYRPLIFEITLNAIN
ncbi:MAG: FKBP-type peptidyl-prolyl cis-trans isomerase [Cyclobacteriaceae bacterium]|nr:FKBP-type peptidyl-prolyl cis-trans isomerase [Cyclobacteriaceae bacterium HetDA_MAG_MS6]